MSHPRFFCPVPLSEHSHIQLPERAAHHASRVLRLKDQSPITLFNGDGQEFPATLMLDGKKAYAQLGAAQDRPTELTGRITLVQGLAASDKMDWIIEKAVELGVSRLVPIRARRSVLQLSPERQVKRLGHWEGIVQSASEQCGRNRLMQLDAPQTLSEFLNQPLSGLVLFCDPEACLHLRQAIRPEHQDIVILVGPEGGWTPEEQQVAIQAGAQAIRFGHRVLRTETAGLALSAAISALQAWE